ncbi:MAG: hypothetical protein K2Q06_10315 [Parvularculaceae bacterium]|nr:hypothetical protein [Parvularculaceae bacterium]
MGLARVLSAALALGVVSVATPAFAQAEAAPAPADSQASGYRGDDRYGDRRGDDRRYDDRRYDDRRYDDGRYGGPRDPRWGGGYGGSRIVQQQRFPTRWRADIFLIERVEWRRGGEEWTCVVTARGPEAGYVPHRHLRRVARDYCSRRSQIFIDDRGGYGGPGYGPGPGYGDGRPWR